MFSFLMYIHTLSYHYFRFGCKQKLYHVREFSTVPEGQPWNDQVGGGSRETKRLGLRLAVPGATASYATSLHAAVVHPASPRNKKKTFTNTLTLPADNLWHWLAEKRNAFVFHRSAFVPQCILSCLISVSRWFLGCSLYRILARAYIPSWPTHSLHRCSSVIIVDVSIGTWSFIITCCTAMLLCAVPVAIIVCMDSIIFSLSSPEKFWHQVGGPFYDLWIRL